MFLNFSRAGINIKHEQAFKRREHIVVIVLYGVVYVGAESSDKKTKSRNQSTKTTNISSKYIHGHGAKRINKLSIK